MDLADRISRGAFAALDLVPDDPRFAQLSSQVLQGGASRFAAIVDPGEDVDYVVPVGVPGASVAFGALVVQGTRIGAVWRDPREGDRHALVALGPGTRARWTPVTIGGQQWARFDVDDLHAAFSFLTPPTATPALRTTLARILGAEVAGQSPTTEPIPALTEASPGSEPSPVPPRPETPPASAPSPLAAASPVREDTVAASQASAPEWSAAPTVATMVPPPAAVPPPTWRPETEVPLYRDEPRAPAPPAWQSDATVVHAPQPHAAVGAPVPAYLPAPVPAAPTPARSRASAALVGFGIAFVTTVVLGGIAMAALMLLR